MLRRCGGCAGVMPAWEHVEIAGIAGSGKTPQRHSREGGNPFLVPEHALIWVPVTGAKVRASTRRTLPMQGVMPAKAGIHGSKKHWSSMELAWVPAFAGTTPRFRGRRRMYNRAEQLPGLLPLLRSPPARGRRCGPDLNRLSDFFTRSQAAIHFCRLNSRLAWIPACAGTTVRARIRRSKA